MMKEIYLINNVSTVFFYTIQFNINLVKEFVKRSAQFKSIIFVNKYILFLVVVHFPTKA